MFEINGLKGKNILNQWGDDSSQQVSTIMNNYYARPSKSNDTNF